jgi:putative ubiquitin-RnfH superfamily antitoxin RatB of RatAB toxin-antitoxin module
MQKNRINIEVVYALPHKQLCLELQVALGTTVGEALTISQITSQVNELQLVDGKIGIFGKVVKLSQILRAGDRIEIYRPLLNDPKEARRRKALDAVKT